MRLWFGLLLAPMFAACSGDAGDPVTALPPAKPKVSIQTFALEASLDAYPNTMLRASGTVTDANGAAVASGFSWTLDGVSVSSSPTFEVALKPGVYSVCLVFQEERDCRSATSNPPQPLAGQVFLASSPAKLAPAGSLGVCAGWNGQYDCTDVNSDGSYSLTTRFVRRDSMVVRAGCRKVGCGVITAEDTVATATFKGAANFAVLANSWTIGAGRWAGVTVNLSPEKAYAKADWYSFYWPALQNFWRTQDIPIKVALDRQGSPGVSITAEDSVVMWKYLNEEMTELGKQFFVPANIEELEVFRGPSQLPIFVGGIGVVLRNDSLGALSGAAWGHPIKGLTDYLTGCQIQFSLHPLSSFKERFVVKHEFFHCLGFGHTPKESWYPGLMTNHQNRADPLNGFLIPEEVAYQQAWYAVSELRVNKKTNSMRALWNGERLLVVN